jgi:hypothetical protein
MTARDRSRLAAGVAACGLCLLASALATATVTCRADDEPRGLARLFRFGNKPAPSQPGATDAKPKSSSEGDDVGAPALSPLPSTNPRTGRPMPPPVDPYPAANPSSSLGGSPYGAGASNPYGGTGRAAPAGAAGSATQAGGRLVPQPRVSRPVTEAPPLLTRIQLGRSDDGHMFGMFLQIHADGTVIDTEGVHKVGADVMRPLVEALRAADVGRIKGHCGGPPVDFVQQVLITVYDPNRGRLQANSFSFSGNPTGCDPAIGKIQAAIDAVQTKISPAVPAAAAAPLTPIGPTGSAALAPRGDDAAPPAPVLGSPRTPAGSMPTLEVLPNG